MCFEGINGVMITKATAALEVVLSASTNLYIEPEATIASFRIKN